MINDKLTSVGEQDTLHDLHIGAFNGASPDDIAARLAAHEARLESISLIVGGIAHDINNLLTVIAGFSELLKMHVGDTGSVGAAISGLGEAAGQMTSVVRLLASLAGQRSVAAEPVPINAVLAGWHRTVAHLLGSGITLEIVRDPAAGVVRAVRGQLDRVLLNLVLNAREAMGETGRLRIEARCARLNERDSRKYGGLKAGDYVRLTVADTGRGMTRQTMLRIFEPLFTTKLSNEGCGHGLATVRRIVRACNGEVFVDSEVGRGTTFEILLPRC